ncbi:MAG TPA: VOC family protein [Solirubrobacteraceae bacterium]|nr:VOC family protein [Solirubrobacteraceae bacterium]
MTERTSYEPGTPSWVDLATPDVDASARFYGELFGWDLVSAGPVEETGGYGMFKLRGRSVAGVGPLMQEGQPQVWSTYVSTDDADAVAARATEAGGTVIVEPMDVMDAGRMAFVVHPAAGAIGVWQPGRTIGAELVNEPGAVGWSELHTRDVDGAKGFYSAVFGWTPQPFGDTGYTIFQLGDQPVAGMQPMSDDAPASWLTYFEVGDCDATVAKAQELGGSEAWPAMEMEGVGRFAGLADAHGIQFAVVTSVQPDE